MSVIYLEDLCKCLDAKANIIVYLSSETIYNLGDGTSLTRQDVCGNHYAKNWIEACEKMPQMFRVKTFKAEQRTDYMQYIITLEQAKNYYTNRLTNLSNEAAIAASFEVDLEF